MNQEASRPDTTDRIEAALATAGVDAAIHVRSIHDDREFALNADANSVSASTYKVAVLLEFACQAAAGELSATRRVHVPSSRRSLGPSGVSAMLDDVEMSLRDLAFMMMHVSDNTATDVVQEIVGTDRMSRRLLDLGLTRTRFTKDCSELVGDVLDELGGLPDQLSRQQLRAAFAASPSTRGEKGNVTTPRDMTALLRAIWRDEAGPADACAEVRRIMGLQYAPHRLSTAYKDGPQISGKTGTFHGGIKNEVGVVDFGDGDSYAVAVFVRQHDVDLRDSAADAVIGTVARIAVDDLRAPVLEASNA